MHRIAISIQDDGEGLAAPMDGRFGRAPRFVLFDAQTHELLQTLANPSQDASHGAGPKTAAMMKEHEVDAVISGRYGPKAADALEALGIEAWIAPAGLTAREAAVQMRDGKLERQVMRTYR